jgi:hypothetical protein
MKKLILAGSLALLTFVTGCSSSTGVEHHSEAKTAHHADANHHGEHHGHVKLDLSNAKAGEKKGFMTTKWCAEQGMFRDCRLETVVCGEEGCNRTWNFGDKEKMNLVLFVHDEGKSYDIHLNHDKLHAAHLIEEAINRNEVTIKGKVDENSNFIYADSYDAPPPPKKSFFKGCL